jgi:hypothetical protein
MYIELGKSLQIYKGKNTEVEVNYNHRYYWELKTRLDSEIEGIANSMEYIIDNKNIGNITIVSNSISN